MAAYWFGPEITLLLHLRQNVADCAGFSDSKSKDNNSGSIDNKLRTTTVMMMMMKYDEDDGADGDDDVDDDVYVKHV